MLKMENLVVGPFQCNCRILVDDQSGDAVVVDPGDEGPKIMDKIAQMQQQIGRPIQVKYYFHTHGHLDHIASTKYLKENCGCASDEDAPKIALHKGDEELYMMLREQAHLFALSYDDPLPVDFYFEDEQTIDLGSMKFSILHTPGHSPGSVCISLHQDSANQIPELLFSGDTLFAGSVGRTDLWGGDQDLMFKSIRQRILRLDDEIQLLPGHGPDSSIGRERQGNPFLV